MKIIKRTTALIFAGFFLILTSCEATKTQESTGQYIDDTVITTRVKTAIMTDASIKSADIVVSSYKGEVQLSGFANSYDQTYKAVALAKSVTGVTTVKNDIRIKP